MTGPRLSRLLWWLLAYTCLLLGLIGIVLPGLPTTVFILLAAWAAPRGSPPRKVHGRYRDTGVQKQTRTRTLDQELQKT